MPQPNNTVITRAALQQRLMDLNTMRDADMTLAAFRQGLQALEELATDLNSADVETKLIAQDAYLNEVDAAQDALTTLAYWTEGDPLVSLVEHELAAFEAAVQVAARLLAPLR